MDDCVLIHPDKAYLKECLKRMEDHIKGDLRLEFNSKTQIFPLRNGVDYLGFHFYLTETGKVIRKLRRWTKIKFKKKLLLMQRLYREDRVELQDVRQVLASYRGHMMYGHTWKLRKEILRSFVLSKAEKNHGC